MDSIEYSAIWETKCGIHAKQRIIFSIFSINVHFIITLPCVIHWNIPNRTCSRNGILFILKIENGWIIFISKIEATVGYRSGPTSLLMYKFKLPIDGCHVNSLGYWSLKMPKCWHTLGDFLGFAKCSQIILLPQHPSKVVVTLFPCHITKLSYIADSWFGFLRFCTFAHF